MVALPHIQTHMEFHEVANIFPLIEGKEFEDLVEDIRINGLQQPIWTYQGKIIDGRNRYRACITSGVEPRYQEWDGKGSLVAFVMSLNLQRRHLTSSQKAMVALEIEKHLAEEAEKRMMAGKRQIDPGTILSQGRSAAQAGVIAGASGTYVKDAKTIVARAPELKEVVTNGVLTIPDAKKIARLSETQRQEAMHLVTTGKAKTASAAVLEVKKAEIDAQAQAAPTKPSLTLASWDTWLPQQSSCDLLITDPPYSTDVEDIESFAQSWLPIALSKVKDSGRAYVCIGAYPRELGAYLNVPVPSHLRLLQVLVWTYKNTLGPSPTNAYKQNWQAILYYVGLNAPKLDCPIMNEQFSVQEINAPDGRLGDRYHAWQKPDELAERLIKHSTKLGDTVLDCFAGTGTFLLATHKYGRVASGCDASIDMLRIAERRGCEIAK